MSDSSGLYRQKVEEESTPFTVDNSYTIPEVKVTTDQQAEYANISEAGSTSEHDKDTSEHNKDTSEYNKDTSEHDKDTSEHNKHDNDTSELDKDTSDHDNTTNDTDTDDSDTEANSTGESQFCTPPTTASNSVNQEDPTSLSNEHKETKI